MHPLETARNLSQFQVVTDFVQSTQKAVTPFFYLQESMDAERVFSADWHQGGGILSKPNHLVTRGIAFCVSRVEFSAGIRQGYPVAPCVPQETEADPVQ